ncbi:hypothetical protein F383_06286 [Gossypium arboreum]|uniref:Uncharacterized protein n=1 Tax=Gossypium arboreum TaxID=29729 RepID=A0A0B0PC29_GOSAR|nr:hypothetical protein F383_06286 [Gossypium arboreum]
MTLRSFSTSTSTVLGASSIQNRGSPNLFPSSASK